MAYTTVYLGDQRCIVADTFAELPTTDDIVIGTPAKVGKNDYTLSQDGEWIQTSFGGAVNVNPSGPPGELLTAVFTCNADTDCITDPTAPAAAELFKATITAGYQRLRVTYLSNSIGVPYAAMGLVTINAPTDAQAVSRLTLADSDVGVSNALALSGEKRAVSGDNPVIEFDLTATDGDITNVYIGGILSAGTGAEPVYFLVEAW